MPWKTAQKKARIRRKIRLALVTLTIFLMLLLAGQMIRFSHSLLSPLSGEKRSYHWDSTFNLNLVALTKPLSVISYNPQDHTVKILEIPDETYLDVPGGFGSWRAGAIYQLGGAKLLKNSMENFLALPIDGFLESGEDKNGLDLVSALRGNPVSLLSSLRTDLTPVELIRLYLGAKGVRFDKIIVFNLKDLGLLTPSSLADGTAILVGDPAKIDALVAKNFTEGKIVAEAATIGVFNSTNQPGLAGKAAQVISHLGGNVIIQTSLEKQMGQSGILGSQNYPYTTKRLEEICNCAILGASASASEFSRASVNLILGQ